MDTARAQIEDALLSYCRGIDRLRPRSIRAAFLPGALLHGYGGDAVPIEEFADAAVHILERRYVATQHRLANTRVEFIDDGRAAAVETYVEASHVEANTDGTPARVHLFVGRYLDRCRPGEDGIWRIAARTLRMDWSKVEAIVEPMGGGYIQSGRGDEPDPLWELVGR